MPPPRIAAEHLVLQFGVPPNRIDLMSSIEGVPFSDAWENRASAVLDDGDRSVTIHYIGLDDLRKNKRATGRPRDLDDLDYLT